MTDQPATRRRGRPKNDPSFIFAARLTLPAACDPSGEYVWVVDQANEDHVYGFLERKLVRSGRSPSTGRLSTVYGYYAYRCDERIVAQPNGRTLYSDRNAAARALKAVADGNSPPETALPKTWPTAKRLTALSRQPKERTA